MAFGVRHGEVGGAAAFVLLLLTGCTEPNPYLEDDGSAADSGSVTSTGPSMDSSGSAPTPSPTNTGTTTTGNNGSDTGELGCADQGMECIAAAPSGWTGPFAWLEADASRTVGCEAPFEDMQTQVFSDLDAPAASCDCTCGALEGAVCSGGQMIYHTGSNCGGLPQPAVNLNPSCNPHGGAGWDISGSFEFVPPTVTSGSCDPEPEVEIPDAEFTTQHLACGSTFAQADCGAERLCVQSPSDPYYPRWCVWQEGDVECPEGDYSQRTLLHQSIDDGRGCQECECELPSGSCMNTTLTLATAATCIGTSAGSVPAGGCTNGVGNDDVEAVTHNVGSAPGGCTASVVGPTGTATEDEPVTFCCMG